MNDFQAFTQRILTKKRNPLAQEIEAVARARDIGAARVVARYRRALEEGDEEGIVRYGEDVANYLALLVQTKDVLAQVEADDEHIQDVPSASQHLALPPPPDVPAYVITSSMVAYTYEHLMLPAPEESGNPEGMLAFTGLHLKERNLRTLEQPLEIQLRTQSVLEASFDMQDFAHVAVTLYNHGQALHGVMHSHRFNGPPKPSDTDWRLQAQLDSGGYPVIQAVFSEDRFVRFFANKPFTVHIYGKGVETIDEHEHLFRLVQVSTLPYPGHGRNGG